MGTGAGQSTEAAAEGRQRAAHLGPERRRPLVLDAALHLFVEHGYRGTSMEGIAAAAAVTKPVVYRCYPNKQELFRALLEREEQRLLESVQAGAPDRARPDRPRGRFHRRLHRAVRRGPLRARLVAHRVRVRARVGAGDRPARPPRPHLGRRAPHRDGRADAGEHGRRGRGPQGAGALRGGRVDRRGRRAAAALRRQGLEPRGARRSSWAASSRAAPLRSSRRREARRRSWRSRGPPRSPRSGRRRPRGCRYRSPRGSR